MLTNSKEEALNMAFRGEQSSGGEDGLEDLTKAIIEDVLRMPGNEVCCDCGASGVYCCCLCAQKGFIYTHTHAYPLPVLCLVNLHLVTFTSAFSGSPVSKCSLFLCCVTLTLNCASFSWTVSERAAMQTPTPPILQPSTNKCM